MLPLEVLGSVTIFFLKGLMSVCCIGKIARHGMFLVGKGEERKVKKIEIH